METTRIRARGTRSEGKGYVAEITGLSSRYGLEREFLRAIECDGDEAVFALEPGKVYEVKDLDKGARDYRFFRFVGRTGHDRGHLLDAETLAKVMVDGKVDEDKLDVLCAPAAEPRHSEDFRARIAALLAGKA